MIVNIKFHLQTENRAWETIGPRLVDAGNVLEGNCLVLLGQLGQVHALEGPVAACLLQHRSAGHREAQVCEPNGGNK